MTKMEKLSVIILEDQVDAVLRSLGEAGTVQFVDIRGKMDAWKGSLVPYGIHVELRTRCSAIISKIEISLKELGLKSESLSQETLLITNERTEDLLAKVEEKLAEIPTYVLAKSSTLLSKIDELAKNLEVKLQDVPVEDKSLHKKKPEDTLKEVENELPTETLAKSSTLLSKIDELAKSLEVKLQDVSTEDKGIEKTSQDELTKTSEAKLQDVSVGDRWLRKYQERALAEVEGKLTRIEQEIVASRLEDKEQKAKKNTPTQEDKNRIGKTLLRLRNSVMDIRLMFSAELSRSRGIVEKVRKSIEAGIDPQRTLKDLLFLRQTVNRELLVLDAKEKLLELPRLSTSRSGCQTFT